MTGPRIGSLFSGYGGLEHGVQAVLGGSTAWVSDIDKGACKILAHRFPDVPNLGDITTVDWSQVEPVDILTGGSPCQDLSHAGKRAGMTEGTRSNLWVAMREAIAQLRPGLVVWENVRGAYSAEADSDLEHCPGCMGDPRDRGPVLRALGRVLGDLSDLGYDAAWHGLRAADVGAPHGRMRVFLVAYPEGDAGRFGYGDSGDEGPRGPGRERGGRAGTEYGVGAGQLLPTPSVADGLGGHLTRSGSRSDELLLPGVAKALALLPTPAVNDMGAAYTPDEWDAWTDRMKTEHGNGNGHGKSLSIEAARLLPTPTSQDSAASGGSTPSDVTLTDAVVRTDLGRKDNDRHASTTEGRPGEVLRDVRGADDPQEVRDAARGPNGLPQAEELLAALRKHEDAGREGNASLAGQEAQGVDLSGLWHDEAAPRSPRGSEPRKQRPGQPDDALRELSPSAPLAGGQGEACGGNASSSRSGMCDLRDDVPPSLGEGSDLLEPVPAAIAQSAEDGSVPPQSWGVYEAAIRQWEMVLGRVAPPPTILSARGTPQLSPRFCEWMMGLPAGRVTDVPGITRNEALKALGNGVVPQQAEAALRVLLPALEVAA